MSWLIAGETWTGGGSPPGKSEVGEEGAPVERAPQGFQATLVTQISCLSHPPTCSPPAPVGLTAGVPGLPCWLISPWPAAFVSGLRSQGLLALKVCLEHPHPPSVSLDKQRYLGSSPAPAATRGHWP